MQGPGSCHAMMPKRAGCLTRELIPKANSVGQSDGSPGGDAGQVKLSYGVNYVPQIHMMKL